MFSLFLDGASHTVPPDPPEATREAPTPPVDESFETHLQRKPDARAADRADEDPEVNDDDNPVHTDHAAAQGADEETPPDARDEHEPRVRADAANDQDPDPHDIEPVDEVLIDNVDLSIEAASIQTQSEAGHVEPELVDGAPAKEPARDLPARDLPARNLEETDVADHARQPQSRVLLPEATTADQVGRDDVTNVEGAENGGKPVARPAPSQDSLALPGAEDGQPGSGDETREVSKDAQPARRDTQPTTRERNAAEAGAAGTGAVEAGAAVKPVPTAVELAVGAVTSVRDAGAETAPVAEESSSPVTATEGKPEAPLTAQGRFAQQLMTAGGERGSRPAATNDVQQARFVDRVARAFRVTPGQGGTIKLRLHPPELGVLQVQLKVQGNAMTARFEAETPVARALLADSLPVLRERLADQGIRIEQFDIDLMERHPQNQPDGTGEHPAGESHDGGAPSAESDPGESRADEPRQTMVGENQQLNIIV